MNLQTWPNFLKCEESPRCSWLVSERAQLLTLFSAAQSMFKSGEKFLCFYFIAFSSIKQLFSSAPKVYGTIFLRIRGTRCLQLQERFSSFQSFLGFSLFYFIRRLKKEDVIKKKATPLIFFFKEMVYICVCICMCMCSVYYFVMIPTIFCPPKFAVIFSPEGAFWLL